MSGKSEKNTAKVQIIGQNPVYNCVVIKKEVSTLSSGESLLREGKIKRINENVGIISVSAERIEAEVAFLSTEEFLIDDYEYDNDPDMDYYDDTEGEYDVF